METISAAMGPPRLSTITGWRKGPATSNRRSEDANRLVRIILSEHPTRAQNHHGNQGHPYDTRHQHRSSSPTRQSGYKQARSLMAVTAAVSFGISAGQDRYHRVARRPSLHCQKQRRQSSLMIHRLRCRLRPRFPPLGTYGNGSRKATRYTPVSPRTWGRWEPLQQVAPAH